MINSRLPPQAVDVEQIVLGAMLLEKSGCKIGIELLSEDVFYNEKYAQVFKIIKDIHSRKDPVDIITVTQELKKSNLINSISAYEVTILTSTVSSSVNIETHCRILLQLFFKRKLIDIGMDAINRGYDDFYDVFDSLDVIKKDIKGIESYISSTTIADNNEIIDKVLDNIKQAKANGGITGYSTGIKSLDIGIMGLRKQLKYVIAALPSQGKTSLAKSICINLAHKQGVPGVFFSMEMPREQIMSACLSEILQIPNNLIQTGDVSVSDEKKILALKNTLFTNNFIIDDRAGLDPKEIRATLRKLKESHGIGWFAMDFLLLMRLKGTEHRGKNQEQILSEITAENKNIAKELDLVCLELTQLTKETSKRVDFRPRINDIRGSGSIEANADVVILIYRPEQHGIDMVNGESSHGFAELIIAKNRFGPIKSLMARYTAEFTQFSAHEGGTELGAIQTSSDDFKF